MRLYIHIALILVSIQCYSQENTLLIARNTGTTTLHDGTEIRTFGFAQRLSENPSIPGPTLVFNEGDSVVIDLWNVSQGAPHTIHLHGLDVNQENDGVPHLSFDVGHMDHGYYRFKAPHPGAYLYHCHVVSVIHVQAGMYGLIIIEPKENENLTWDGGYSFSKEHSFVTSEIDTNWHINEVLLHDTSAHNIKVPQYNPGYFLVNGESQHVLRNDVREIKNGDNAYLRFANIGYMANVIHLPKSFNSRIISSDGRPLPNVLEQDSLIVYPGERYGVLVNSTTLGEDSVLVNYFDMNNGSSLGIESIVFFTVDELNAEQLESNSIEIFPNPAHSQLHIKLADNQEIRELRVFNIQGQTTVTPRIANSISLNSLNPGTYYLELVLESGEVIHHQFVKTQ